MRRVAHIILVLLALLLPAALAAAAGAAALIGAPNYDARQKGILALEGFQFDLAEKFFLEFRQSARGGEPALADVTVLLVKLHLRRNSEDGLVKAEAALAYQREHSAGAPPPYYQQALAYWQAATLLRRGRDAEAENLAREIVASNDGGDYRAFALQLLAAVMVRRQEWQQAEDLIGMAMQANPGSELRLHLQASLCRTYIATGRQVAAAALISELSQNQDPAAVGTVGLLRIFLELQTGNVEAAHALYREQEARRPVIPDAEWWIAAEQLAASLRQAGQYAAAAEVFSQAALLAASRDKKLRALVQRAECLVELRQAEAVRLAAKILIETFPGAPETLPALLKAGDLLKQEGDLPGALALFDEAARNEDAPANLGYRAASSRGWCLRQLERYIDAEAAFAAAAKFGQTPEEQAEALLLAGDAAALGKDLNAAALRYQQVGERYAALPAAEEARLKQARARAKAGPAAAAAAVYALFIKEYPETKHLADARFERGICLRQAGEYAAAIAELREFSTTHHQHKNVPQALLEAAQAAVAINDVKQAFELLGMVVESYDGTENHHLAWQQRIYLHFSQGNYPQALADAEEFLQRYKDGLESVAKVLMWLGDYHCNRQAAAEGEKYYLRVADEFSASPHAPVALYEAAYSAFSARKDSAAAVLLTTKLLANYRETASPELLSRAAMLLGDAMVEQGNFGAAAERFQEAATLAAEG